MNVLVTGAFGKTAFAIIKKLKNAGLDVIGFDLSTASCPDQTKLLFKDILLGDVGNFDQVEKATRDIDFIIHLAVAVGNDIYQNPDIPFKVNVEGTYNIFESARINKVKKIVHMNSAAVHVDFKKGEKISALEDWQSSAQDSPLYDLTKRLQEEVAKEYCETHGLNVVVLRAGHIVDGRQKTDLKGRPLASLDYCRGGWICRYDLANACLKALTLKKNGYNVFHIIGSERAKDHFDIERTENVLGLNFQNRFEETA